MDKLDKVIKGLECCTEKAHCEMAYCPYCKEESFDCGMNDMMKDALELLKPRVLTLDEALGSDDPVYFESNGRMECWVDAYISDDLQCAVFYRFRATEFMLPLSRYKKDWRCWSSPPLYEQSKAVKWE